MSKRELVLSTRKLPAHIRSLCGTPPVLRSERRTDYESLFRHMADCVKPTDSIEWLWLKDVVDHTWEMRRLRRFKNQLIELGLPPTESFYARENDPLSESLRAWSRAAYEGCGHFIDKSKEVDKEEPPEKPKQRKKRPSEADAVQAFRQCINEYQAIDRLLSSAEDRRNVLLREIDRRRDGLGQRLRQSSDDVIDADFSETAVAAE